MNINEKNGVHFSHIQLNFVHRKTRPTLFYVAKKKPLGFCCQTTSVSCQHIGTRCNPEMIWVHGKMLLYQLNNVLCVNTILCDDNSSDGLAFIDVICRKSDFFVAFIMHMPHIQKQQPYPPHTPPAAFLFGFIVVIFVMVHSYIHLNTM